MPFSPDIKKVGIVGLGSISQRHLRNIKQLYPDAITLAMSASGRITGQPVANADQVIGSVEELIASEPDFVIVCSPATCHFSHAEPLYKAGIPLLVEKPVTGNAEEANAFLELVADGKVPVAVAYCLRYMPASSKVKKLLEQNHLGSIYSVSASVGQYLPHWRKDKDYRDSVSTSLALGGGVLLELSHELDYLQWLLGPLQLQYARLRNSHELQLEVEEIADIMLDSASGTCCYVHLDFLQKFPQRQCTIIGEKGRIEWNLIENSVYLYLETGKQCVYSEPDWDRNNMYLSMIEEFVASIKHGAAIKTPIGEAVQVVALIDAIKQFSGQNHKRPNTSGVTS